MIKAEDLLMSIGELIALLQAYDKDAKVYLGFEDAGNGDNKLPVYNVLADKKGNVVITEGYYG